MKPIDSFIRNINGVNQKKRKFAMSDDIDLADLKKKCKKYGATINEYFIGIVNMSIYEYTEGKEPSPTLFYVPISTHEPFED